MKKIAGVGLLTLGFAGVVMGVVNSIVDQRLYAIFSSARSDNLSTAALLAAGFAMVMSGIILVIRSDETAE
ncbi:MAG TPA: hypothetical protein VNT79_11905 [Phycisphaerae bacterium]|nr:hypothetical protein [Phycisphaerae bacterium]